MYEVSVDSNGLYYTRTIYYNMVIKRFVNADTEKRVNNDFGFNCFIFAKNEKIEILINKFIK